MDDMDLRKKYMVLRRQLFKTTSPKTRNQTKKIQLLENEINDLGSCMPGKVRRRLNYKVNQQMKTTSPKTRNQTKKIQLLENEINDLGSCLPGKVRRRLNYKVKQQMNKNVKLQETEIHQQKHLNEGQSTSDGSNIDVQKTVKRFLNILKGDSSNHRVVMKKKEIKETMYKYVQLMQKIYAASIANQISLLESLKEKAICLRSPFPLSVRKMLKKSIIKIIKNCKKDSLGIESASSVSDKIESNFLEYTVTPSVSVKTESNSTEYTVTPSISVKTVSNSTEYTVTPSISVKTESNSTEYTVTPSVSVKTESNSTNYGSQMLKSQNVIEKRGISEDIVTTRKRTMSCDDFNFLKNKKLKNCALSSLAKELQSKNEININEGHDPTKSLPHLPTPETVVLENKSNRGWKMIEEELFSNQHILSNSQLLLKSPMTTRTFNSINVSRPPHLS